jgi:hypothetical protein
MRVNVAGNAPIDAATDAHGGELALRHVLIVYMSVVPFVINKDEQEQLLVCCRPPCSPGWARAYFTAPG